MLFCLLRASSSATGPIDWQPILADRRSGCPNAARFPEDPWEAEGRRPSRHERHFLLHSQWLAMPRCAQTVGPTVDARQSIEAMRRQRHLRPDKEEPCCGTESSKEGEDRSEQPCAIGSSMPTQVPRGTPNGGVPAVESGGSDNKRGHLIGRTKC